MIVYVDDCDLVPLDDLGDFFVGWPQRPTTDVFGKAMRGSARCLFAVEDGRLVGYLNAPPTA